jgi:hypothetical protein
MKVKYGSSHRNIERKVLEVEMLAASFIALTEFLLIGDPSVVLLC